MNNFTTSTDQFHKNKYDLPAYIGIIEGAGHTRLQIKFPRKLTTFSIFGFSFLLFYILFFLLGLGVWESEVITADGEIMCDGAADTFNWVMFFILFVLSVFFLYMEASTVTQKTVINMTSAQIEIQRSVLNIVTRKVLCKWEEVWTIGLHSDFNRQGREHIKFFKVFFKNQKSFDIDCSLDVSTGMKIRDFLLEQHTKYRPVTPASSAETVRYTAAELQARMQNNMKLILYPQGIDWTIHHQNRRKGVFFFSFLLFGIPPAVIAYAMAFHWDAFTAFFLDLEIWAKCIIVLLPLAGIFAFCFSLFDCLTCFFGKTIFKINHDTMEMTVKLMNITRKKKLLKWADVTGFVVAKDFSALTVYLKDIETIDVGEWVNDHDLFMVQDILTDQFYQYNK